MESKLLAITYIGRTPGYTARYKKDAYEFEWQKSVGIGNRAGEIPPKAALSIAKIKDRKGKRLFYLDRIKEG